jgi:hypothetical protein
MQATARRLSVVSATSCARRRLIRDVRPTIQSAMPETQREHVGHFVVTSQRNLSNDGSIICAHCQKVLAAYDAASDQHSPTPETLTGQGAIPVPNFGWLCSQDCAVAYEEAHGVNFRRDSSSKISYYDASSE